MMGWNNHDYWTTKVAISSAHMPDAQIDCTMVSSYCQMIG